MTINDRVAREMRAPLVKAVREVCDGVIRLYLFVTFGNDGWIVREFIHVYLKLYIIDDELLEELWRSYTLVVVNER